MSQELDRNIRVLQSAEDTLRSLEEVINSVPVKVDDPDGLKTAIRQMEEAVDLHMAHFSAYPVVGRMVENFKGRYRAAYAEQAKSTQTDIL
ncbi:MAG TPA: hypothetical protein VEF76_10470 [Patescibacteria group bacterium]|nr:hypothetical protein [Patescibacteria group bacterium]